MADEPFLKAPVDEHVQHALDRIRTLPPQNGDSPLAGASTEDMLRVFSKMPPYVQQELINYSEIVQQALIRYALSGDSAKTVLWIIDQLPSMLFRPDQTGHIPIEAALESGNDAAAKFMLAVADRSQTLPRLLKYKNRRFGHSLIMLAVSLNEMECADILQTLISGSPSELHQCYDNEGRNVFHRCTQFGFSTSFQIICNLIMRYANAYSTIVLSELKNTLEMTDKRKMTPLHNILASGSIEMLNCLKRLLECLKIEVNFDVCFKSSTSVTPLMVGVQNGHLKACKWLLENGSIDVHFKQHSTCLTALHFAVRVGNPKLIALLMRHGANPEFLDDRCAQSEGYKTPLELAKTEEIPNKQACLEVLKKTA